MSKIKHVKMRFWNRHPWLIAAIAALVSWTLFSWQYREVSRAPLAQSSAFDAARGGEYIPGTETLAPDEMRITALGTGMPVPYPSDASSAWLIELGNGDVFLFDIGSGTAPNFNALRISHSKIKGIFLSHLHADHVGAFVPFWISGWMGGGRYQPMQIWGPSGSKPEFGTQHFVEHQIESMAWDTANRQGAVPAAGGEADVHEFDFAKVQIVYDHNGVTVKSFPQPHGLDGAVGYRLEWKGLSFVYGGDAAPNRWFVENGLDADVLVHEALIASPPKGDAGPEAMGIDISSLAKRILSLHTTPRAAARVFELTKPRLAVVNHYYNRPELEALMEEQVSEVYSGPVVYARDMTVINVTAEKIISRQTVLPELSPTFEEIPAIPEAAAHAKRNAMPEMSEWLIEGLIDLDEDNFPDFGGPKGFVMKKIMTRAAKDMPPLVDPEELVIEPAG